MKKLALVLILTLGASLSFAVPAEPVNVDPDSLSSSLSDKALYELLLSMLDGKDKSVSEVASKLGDFTVSTLTLKSGANSLSCRITIDETGDDPTYSCSVVKGVTLPDKF
ncbi:MAG: hypothetical protein V4736_02590 [Bdellovibrionota bacterium]